MKEEVSEVIEKHLSEEEWVYLLDGYVSEIMAESFDALLDTHARGSIFDVNVNKLEIYYKDSILWSFLYHKPTHIVMTLNYAVLLVVQDVYVPSGITNFVLTDSSSTEDILKGREIVRCADIYTDCDIVDNCAGLFRLSHSRCLIKQYNLKHLGYADSYTLVGGRGYKRPDFTLGYCKYFNMEIMANNYVKYLDMLDWSKDFCVSYVAFNLNFAHVAKDDVKHTAVKFGDVLLPWIQNKFNSRTGLQAFNLRFKLLADKVVGYDTFIGYYTTRGDAESRLKKDMLVLSDYVIAKYKS